MGALRLWKLGLAANIVRDRKTGKLKARTRLLWGRKTLLGLDRHPHPACSMKWSLHIHLGECWVLALCPRPRLYKEKRCRPRRGGERR